MKFYYIDDSMFQKSEFATEIRYRFEKILQQNAVSMILISTGDPENKMMRAFIKQWNLLDTVVVKSPALFETGAIRGKLQTAYIAVEGYPNIQSFSGTCVEFDEAEHSCRRIYLDVFTEYHEDEMSFETLIEELEEMIQSKISGVDNKKPYH